MPRKTKSIADQLRQAIRQAERRGVTRYQIAKEAEIAQSTLSQFFHGDGQLRLDIAESVARAVNFQLRLDKQ